MDAIKVGSKICELRTAHNMTQKELAALLYVTDKAVSKWENGGGLPDLRQMPAIASIFGVTVDDIISDNDLPTKNELALRKINKWTSRSKALLIIIALLIMIGIGFTVFNSIWASYVSETFDPFLKNENLQAIPQWNRREFNYRGSRLYEFSDFNGSGYFYAVQVPGRFRFNGNVSISTAFNSLDSDYGISLMIFIGHRGDWNYILGIIDFTANEYDEYGEVNTQYGSAVDRYGQPLERHPQDSEEHYQHWLYLHNNFNEPIIRLFADIKDFFGESTFR